MKNKIFTLFLTLGLLSEMQVFAFEGSNNVMVEEAWARASISKNRPSVVYMSVHNLGGQAVKLLGLSSPRAKLLDVHETTIDDKGISSMSPVPDLVIPAKESVFLKPGGMHIMLRQLPSPLIEGETFSLSLDFDNGEKLTIDVKILGIAAREFKN